MFGANKIIESAKGLHGFCLGRRYGMGIDVGCGAGLGVIQLPGNHHQGNAVGDHQGGVGVPEAMHCHLRAYLEQSLKILRKVHRSGKRIAALSSLLCIPRPRLLFLVTSENRSNWALKLLNHCVTLSENKGAPVSMVNTRPS